MHYLTAVGNCRARRDAGARRLRKRRRRAANAAAQRRRRGGDAPKHRDVSLPSTGRSRRSSSRRWPSSRAERSSRSTSTSATWSKRASCSRNDRSLDAAGAAVAGQSAGVAIVGGRPGCGRWIAGADAKQQRSGPDGKGQLGERQARLRSEQTTYKQGYVSQTTLQQSQASYVQANRPITIRW